MGFHHPYPIPEPRMPEQIGLTDLFVMGMISPFLNSTDQESFWEKFELPYRIEALLNFGCNLVMSIGNSETVAESLAKIPFMVSFDLYLNETSNFADIVLPDCSYLQSYDSRSNFPFIFGHPAGLGEWCWPIRQPVLPPDADQRRCADVLLEIAHRAGFGDEVNAAYNAMMGLEPPYRLEPGENSSYEEICDRDLKNNFGADKGLDWFRKNGVVKWPKKVEEVYWRHFVDVRVPIYWEFLVSLGEKTEAITAPRGLTIPREYYEPMPDFIPCKSHGCTTPEFDFTGFYYRDTIHTNSYTMENPWLDETAQLDPFSYAIAINAETGRKKGLRNGQLVWVENENGRKVKGRIKLTQGIHPEGLGIGACAGHWSDGMPVAKGKGVFYNELLEVDWEHSSPVNLNLDLCVRVKVTPVES